MDSKQQKAEVVQEEVHSNGFVFLSVLIYKPQSKRTAITIIGPDCVNAEGEIENPRYFADHEGDIQSARLVVREQVELVTTKVLIPTEAEKMPN